MNTKGTVTREEACVCHHVHYLLTIKTLYYMGACIGIVYYLAFVCTPCVSTEVNQRTPFLDLTDPELVKVGWPPSGF